jgi:hypothetical protein
MTAPFPALTSLELPSRQLAAKPGDVIKLNGYRLAGATARLISTRIKNPPQPVTAPATDVQLSVTLPANIAPGFYTIAVDLVTSRGTITSNELSFGVAPVITTALPLTVTRAGGTATIDIVSSVDVLLEQRVSLLVGDFEALRTLPASPPASTKTFEFVIKTPTGGDFPVPIGVPLMLRLRVDGVDSEIIAPLGQGQPESTPFEFDAAKKITIN